MDDVFRDFLSICLLSNFSVAACCLTRLHHTSARHPLFFVQEVRVQPGIIISELGVPLMMTMARRFALGSHIVGSMSSSEIDPCLIASFNSA